MACLLVPCSHSPFACACACVPLPAALGISRDSRHKRRATGGKKPQTIKKRKYELGRQSASTKLGAKRIHTVRVRGGRTLALFRGKSYRIKGEVITSPQVNPTEEIP